jgi:hypothetical protein
VFISTVPISLITIIEAPVPVMLGFTKDIFETLKSDYKDIESKIWVFVDEQRIDIPEREKYVCEPHLGGLKAELESLVKDIKAAFDAGNISYIKLCL